MKYLVITALLLFSAIPLIAQDWQLSVTGGLQAIIISDTETPRYGTAVVSPNSGLDYYPFSYSVASEFKGMGGGFVGLQLARSLNERWSIHHNLGLNVLAYNSKTSRVLPADLASLEEENVNYENGTTGNVYSYSYVRDGNGDIVYHEFNGESYPEITGKQVSFDLYTNKSAGNTVMLLIDQQLGASYQTSSRWSFMGGLGFSYRVYSRLVDTKVLWEELHPEYDASRRQAVFSTEKDRSGTGFRRASAHVYGGLGYTLRPGVMLNFSVQKSITNLYNGAAADIASNVPGAAYPLLLKIGASYRLKSW